MKTNEIIRIEKYLEGKMSKIEEDDFKKDLDGNETLKSTYDRIIAIRKSIELKGSIELLEEMNRWEGQISHPPEDTIEETIPNSLLSSNSSFSNTLTRHRKNTFNKPIFKIAAAISILCIAYWTYKKTHTSAPTEPTEFVHYASNMTTMRSLDNNVLSKSVRRAYDLYEIKEYALAAPLLEDLYKKEDKDDHLFYAALAYLYSNNHQKAVNLLTTISLKNEQKRYLEEINLSY